LTWMDGSTSRSKESVTTRSKENVATQQRPRRLHSRTEAARLVQDADVHAWLRKRQRPRCKPVARSFVSRHKYKTIKSCFEALDTDHSGSIDRDELSFALSELGLSADHASTILSEGDADCNGTITLDEFVSLVNAISARQAQRSTLLESEPRGPVRVASAFTEMLEQAATAYPLGLLANAVHIREAVAKYDPNNYESRFTAEEDAALAAADAAPPAPPPPRKLPALLGQAAEDANSRAASAPLLKSSSHRRWLAQAGKTDTRMRIHSASAARGPSHKLLPVAPPPALTHAATAPRLPNIRR